MIGNLALEHQDTLQHQQVLAMPRLDRLVNCARFVVIPSENVGEEFRFVVTPNKASDLTRKEEDEEDPETDARVRVLQELAGDVKLLGA